MKFEITLKTPDATYGIVEKDMPATHDNGPDYRYSSISTYENKFDEVSAQADAIVNKFIKYGELITIQFDAEIGTATVVPVRK